MKSLRCILGRHTGQAQGGTMMFYCPRCDRDLWQPLDYSAATRAADAAIARGDADAAHRMVRDALRER